MSPAAGGEQGTDMTTKIDVPVGGLWEFRNWALHRDYVVSDSALFGAQHAGPLCPHCTPVAGATGPFSNWMCPLVVVARNEAGCNSTGMCALCIVDAVKSGGQA